MNFTSCSIFNHSYVFASHRISFEFELVVCISSCYSTHYEHIVVNAKSLEASNFIFNSFFVLAFLRIRRKFPQT